MPERLAGGVGERAPDVVELLAVEADSLEVVRERLEGPRGHGRELPAAGQVEGRAGRAGLGHRQAATVGQAHPGVVELVPVDGGEPQPLYPLPGRNVLTVDELGAQFDREAREVLVAGHPATESVARLE